MPKGKEGRIIGEELLPEKIVTEARSRGLQEHCLYLYRTDHIF
jgi:hypothetical protein